ncbi:hypothetical protein [Pleomorphovibrio marinus]|uniref:hypothetical protein n=1 Tax=Pleomorphovibrio marinus TaxID=2164132 RepID=UPI000E0A1405|nr:hypothetical protein [Pleomorphovibrio marinus]
MHFVFKFLVFMVLVAGLNRTAFSQNQTHLPDLRGCGQSCSSNNFDIQDVFLSDQFGTPITTDLLTCESGEEQIVYITFEYSTNSNSAANNGRLFADLVVGEDEQFLNYYFGTIASAKDTVRKLTLSQFPMTWVCGEVVLLKDPTLAWTTSAGNDLSEDYECGDYPNAQCQKQTTIVVEAPLAVQFEHEAACLDKGTSTVSFESTTNGGKEPYTYKWEFTNATYTTALVANPVVEFSESGTAKLTVTDANNTQNTYEKVINIPVAYEITAISTEQTDEENPDGTIVLEMDPAGDYTFDWSGPNGFSSDQKDLIGLEGGIYEVWVTDAFGCSQWMEVEVDLAAALPVKWGPLQGEPIPGSGVNIQWVTYKEVQTSHFEIERSLNPREGFDNIGSIMGSGWSNNATEYSFTDTNLPQNINLGWLYYRIKEVSFIGEVMYSDLIRVQIHQTASPSKSWKLFPNPYESDLLWLQGYGDNAYEESVQVTVISPHKQVEMEAKIVEGKASIGSLLEGYSKGVYIVRVCSGGNCEQMKLIKH